MDCPSMGINIICSAPPKTEIGEEAMVENFAESTVVNASQPPSSSISQKSMSTTNLFDTTEMDKRASVASTNQAASAESLQHQTPSLENLLARSRIYDERIPEVVLDDATPNLEDEHELVNNIGVE
ncbi:unnamed protein product [Gongylonema pulchrum]|uniref:Uncharacterized protein n=1 Tax=Gongylonema pulchrum TaxID=637853 RepID=A0A183E4Z3_9BILA|nr:unnamed protein product [Gongylonema pulchrum]